MSAWTWILTLVFYRMLRKKTKHEKKWKQKWKKIILHCPVGNYTLQKKQKKWNAFKKQEHVNGTCK